MNLQFTRYDMFHDANVEFLHWKYFIQNRDHLTSIKRMDKYLHFLMQSNRGKGKYFCHWLLYQVFYDNDFLFSKIAPTIPMVTSNLILVFVISCKMNIWFTSLSKNPNSKIHTQNYLRTFFMKYNQSMKQWNPCYTYFVPV